MIDLQEAFEKFDDEYIKFDRAQNKLHDRPDICAFLLLDKLLPKPGFDIVCSAAHDEIFLDVDCEALSEVATEDDILLLIRCGVRYSEEEGCLAMFA